MDDKLDSELRELVARMGKRKSESAREALGRQLAQGKSYPTGERIEPVQEFLGGMIGGGNGEMRAKGHSAIQKVSPTHWHVVFVCRVALYHQANSEKYLRGTG